MEDDKTHFGYQTIPASLKTERVREVFSSVANRYDLMNDLMSFGLHRLWKRLAVAKTAARADDFILDLAGGTGDISLQFSKQLGPKARIVLADINAAMLSKGQERITNAGIVRAVSFIQASAESLPFGNQCFDRIISAFGLRNMTHKEKALEEMCRVLKAGGRTVILEFSTVNSPWLSKLYDAYSFSVLPKLGKWVCNDAESYQYLAESIRVHPDQETLKSMMLGAGFKSVEYQNLHAGLIAVHTGYKA